MSLTDQSPQRQGTTHTPGLARSPKGRFDAQAALRALEADDEEGLVATLMTVKWGRTGYQAMVTIEEALGPAIAAPLFRHYWPSRPDEVQARLLRLADDEDWLVREAAHSTMGSLLIAHFDALYPILQSWARHPSANVRRGVAIAARQASNERREEWAEILLNLVKPLLADHDKYVRKNLGSYAIGDGLLRCYPELTLRYLEKWAESDDEQVRWNVASQLRRQQAMGESVGDIDPAGHRRATLRLARRSLGVALHRTPSPGAGASHPGGMASRRKAAPTGGGRLEVYWRLK
jgi:3-methyladenine DNA glycosylase AlkC